MKKIIFAIALLSLLNTSCSRPTPVGSDLLEQDRSDISFNDTLTMATRSVTEDSVLTYSSDVSRQLSIYLCGNLKDPVFGNSNASIYTQFRYGSSGVPDFSDSTITLDSVVLLLAYDTLGFYGDTTVPQSVEIYRITETMDSVDTYFSNASFTTENQVIGGVYNFIPRPKSRVALVSSAGDTLSTLNPHLRIRLDDAFGAELLDTSNYSSEETFFDAFKGLHIRPAAGVENMMGFQLLGPVTSITRLSLFYTEDTTELVYSFIVSERAVKLTSFEHDYSTSDIPQFLGDPIKGDSLLFIQGMSGPNIQIDFPTADQLGNIIVNKAQLEFTVAILPNDDEAVFTPPNVMIVAEKDDDGDFILIDDVTLNFNAFGGRMEEFEDGSGNTLIRYRFNISSHFQRYPEGNSIKPIFLRIFGKQETGARAVFYGPKHSQYPAKLNLAYTILN